MFGAETILMNRCRTKELFEQTVHLINDFKEYFLSHGEPVGENPSPGNKAGGISTLEDKALGCTQKCGKAYVDGVMGYGDRLKVKGLNLLSAPGNDLVAATALASCGCHMVLFTTGRGTPVRYVCSHHEDLHQLQLWLKTNRDGLISMPESSLRTNRWKRLASVL